MSIRNEQIRQVLALLGSPEMVNQSHEMAIRTFISAYPFVQPAYYILAKATLHQDSNFEDKSLAATYGANGEILYRTIFEPHKFETEKNSIVFENLKTSLKNVSKPWSFFEYVSSGSPTGITQGEIEPHAEEIIQDVEVIEEVQNEIRCEKSPNVVQSEMVDEKEEEIVSEIPEIELGESTELNGEKIFENQPVEPLQYSVETFDHIDSVYHVPFISPFENIPSDSESVNEVFSMEDPKFIKAEPSSVVEDTAFLKSEDSASATISKYDDEAMPYSFQWWLQKTRSDYYELNYQPFAKSGIAVKKDAVHFNKNINTEENPLEDQYKQHIFSIQTPFKTEELLNNDLSTTDKTRVTEIIDRFIEKDPQISAPEPNKLDNDNKARQSTNENSELVTETLAKIYVEQMLFDKAVMTYQKLSLKIPEKSSYFASIITQLEGKINNT